MNLGPGATAAVKIENQKGKDGGEVTKNLVCGLSWASKAGWKAHVKCHPFKALKENPNNSPDLKASVLYPVTKDIKACAEFTGDLAAPMVLNPKYSAGLACGFGGMLGGVWYHFGKAKTPMVGANLHKKISAGEVGVEVFTPLEKPAISWVAGL